VGSGPESSADFDLAFFPLVSMESRRPDDPALFGISGDHRSAGFQSLAKEHPENLFFVTVLNRMLLPDEGISSYGQKVVKDPGSKRPEFEELTFQDWLEIKGHS